MILFELLIALSLTAVLLTFLFSFFVESARIEKKLEKARMAVLTRNHLQTRIQTVLSSLHAEGVKSVFYTQRFEREKEVSLVAHFDHGIDPNPAYSGSVLGRIYLDERGDLCLAIWPLGSEKKQPWRQETLLSHVKSFEFEFLGKISATDHGKKEKIKPITPTLAWRNGWSKSETEVPSMIRLTIEEEGGDVPLEFAFILPEAKPLVTYREKKVS